MKATGEPNRFAAGGVCFVPGAGGKQGWFWVGVTLMELSFFLAGLAFWERTISFC